jgi:RND family efflux transporter MFP subunit
MTHSADVLKRWARWGGRVAAVLGFAAGVVLLILWLAGRFSPKVPARGLADQAQTPAVEGQLAPARVIRLPLVESAVGTVRAVHEATVGSRLLARVVEVNLKAGQEVKSGDVLVRLDDTELQAKFEQAEAAVTAAEAVRAQAVLEERRYRSLVKSQSVSQQDYDKAATALRSAEAELRRAQEAVKEVQATLDWATVRSPIDGTVIDKKVEMGDMVTPGQVLVTLFDPERMQLVASVRESLSHRLHVGQDIDAQIEGLNKQCRGTISEIVPEAQSASRTFQVKVTGPCPPGVYTGMFGRIFIPLEEEQVLVIPRRAVRTVGQLELVDAAVGGAVSRRAIRTGRVFDEDVEVLSGLREGEQVALPTPPDAAREASHD